MEKAVSIYFKERDFETYKYIVELSKIDDRSVNKTILRILKEYKDANLS